MGKSALGVMKEFAEKPFRLWDMRGKQFTITEDLPKTKIIRETQAKAQKTGKPYTLYLIKVQEGIFEKDIQLYESDLETLFMKMPTSLVNYKGATLTLSNDPVSPVMTYIGQVTDDMNENFPKPTQSPTNTPGPHNDQTEDKYRELAQAITFSQKIGIQTTKDKVLQIAVNIVPGQDAEAFIHGAKMAGWIVERDHIFTGTA
ncbi:MAG: hypothetical protein O8C58_05995 [Candidatus Methanoperedens sp.]|nr:hypothetical protein [Candidatus Methanoperedens sp.]